jgi:ketopantoate hydroxymethyltransferase
LEATRRSFNKDFLLALAADFKQHGASAIETVRKQQPGTYMKICAHLVPKEMRVEHTGGVKAMSDEQLEQGIEAIQAMLAARDAGTNAKVIEGVAEPVPGPRKTKRKRRKTDGDMVTTMGMDGNTTD